MKCISLWQPWATLMAIGAKKIETRSWETLYRGPLAIHAAKKWDRELLAMCRTEPFRSVLLKAALEADGVASHADQALSFGAIVCVVNLDDCRRVHDGWVPDVSDNEIAFGDYTPGRFAWITSGVRRLDKPIPFRGAQGLFEVPDNLVHQ